MSFFFSLFFFFCKYERDKIRDVHTVHESPTLTTHPASYAKPSWGLPKSLIGLPNCKYSPVGTLDSIYARSRIESIPNFSSIVYLGTHIRCISVCDLRARD